MTQTKGDYPKATDAMVQAGVVVYIAGLFILISFASPYWVESFEDTHNDFKHMGLWEYCFKDFRFPYNIYDKIFDGCYYVYSFEVDIIREWLLPGWLFIVQIFITLAFMCSFTSQILVALTVMRTPKKFILMYEWLMTGVIFLCNALASVFLFLGLVIFWSQSSRRTWLRTPNYIHLSWSFYFAIASFGLHSVASKISFTDARKAWETREEKRSLVMQMYPMQERTNGFI